MSKTRVPSLNECLAVALVIAVTLCAGCAKHGPQTSQTPSPPEPPKAEPARQPETAQQASASTPANVFRVEGAASTELDEIVGRIGARQEGKMLASTINMLSEGHARPQRGARVNSTIGGFSAKGTAGTAQIAAYSDSQIKIEANADGSNAKITSPLTGTVAKVYANLTLPRSKVMIPKGTVLRRDETAWIADKDPKLESRLAEIGKGSTSRAISLGITPK